MNSFRYPSEPFTYCIPDTISSISSPDTSAVAAISIPLSCSARPRLLLLLYSLFVRSAHKTPTLAYRLVSLCLLSELYTTNDTPGPLVVLIRLSLPLVQCLYRRHPLYLQPTPLAYIYAGHAYIQLPSLYRALALPPSSLFGSFTFPPRLDDACRVVVPLPPLDDFRHALTRCLPCTYLVVCVLLALCNWFWYNRRVREWDLP